MYMVTVMAADPDGGYDSIMVTINVTDVNEAPTFDQATAARSVDENSAEGTPVGDPVTAMDPDDGDTLEYSLSGDDAMYFTIDEMGQIKVGAGTVLDYETKSSYSLTVNVEDSMGMTATIDVTVAITVTDVNEPPIFNDGTMATRSIAENTEAKAEIGNPLTAADPEDDKLSYSLGGDDAAYFGINSGTGQLMTKEPLDHETKSSYSVTVTATETETDPALASTIDVTINITNVEEMGMLALSTMRPTVGTGLTATLTDPDVVMEDSVTWQWSRSKSSTGTFVHIAGYAMTYTPTDDDVGYYLRVMATYADGHGSGKTATAQTDSMVVSSLMAKHDNNSDGQIDINEVIEAIEEYQAGDIDINEVIEVIELYQANQS